MPAMKKETFSSFARAAASKSKLSMSLDYIFGGGTSKKLNFDSLRFEHSRRTGRLRYVVDKVSGEILFTLRPNGSIAPTLLGAKFMLGPRKRKAKPRWVVIVIDGVSEFISQGRSVFCRHVASCDDELRAGEDVAILNESGELLAVGKTIVPGAYMKQFKKGVAVKVREGINGSTVV